MCCARILTLMAWLTPCPCMHVLYMHTAYVCSWAHTSATYVHVMHVPCIYTYPTAWFTSRLGMHVLCISTYSHGLAHASPMSTYAMHVYLLSSLGSRLVFVCMCLAHTPALTTLLAPRLGMHVSCVYTYSYSLAHTSFMYTCATHVYSPL